MSSADRQPEQRVRIARAADAATVGILTEGVYAAGGWADEQYSRALLDAGSRIADGLTFVAEYDHRIVGTVTLALPGSQLAEVAVRGEAEVRMLAVEGAARGQGVGAALMDACESRARAEGCAAVVLSTEPGMLSAHQLYRRRGYRRTPERDWSIRSFTLQTYRLEL